MGPKRSSCRSARGSVCERNPGDAGAATAEDSPFALDEQVEPAGEPGGSSERIGFCVDEDVIRPSEQAQASTSVLEGRRVVDIGHLFRSVQGACDHAPFSCSFADMAFVSEQRRGLHSSFTFVCKMCNKKAVIESEVLPHTAEAKSRMDVNTAAVSGIISVGCKLSNLAELLASMNVEEARRARESGEIDAEGCPLVTVVADGAWSKRSYKNKYDAPSGMAAIVGHSTHKVLFLGVRNKFCIMCARTKPGETPPDHRCFKNWQGS
ncbi:uncharacterized protein LOC120849343 [Ixodes scapularis]|uniref:uncharacterized protein LOC120849343 n=1 Tax=Ixodes scapularis TaxID=6945 RepID=UPI001C388DD7|nr:uncharacterized protein LOC120849343 [Ixodes scapularis]